MDFSSIDIPPSIYDCLISLTDIVIDGFSEKGANGYVFFGFHKIKNQRVALKFYYYGNEIHKEVQLLSQINHPNIISVWDARTVGAGWAYFMTAESSAGDIDGYIQTNGVKIKEAIFITRGILNGLGLMHSTPNNMLHRDLKPANILLDVNCRDKCSFFPEYGSVHASRGF
jgi:serine/threonine protein kinase